MYMWLLIFVGPNFCEIRGFLIQKILYSYVYIIDYIRLNPQIAMSWVLNPQNIKPSEMTICTVQLLDHCLHCLDNAYKLKLSLRARAEVIMLTIPCIILFRISCNSSALCSKFHSLFSKLFSR